MVSEVKQKTMTKYTSNKMENLSERGCDLVIYKEFIIILLYLTYISNGISMYKHRYVTFKKKLKAPKIRTKEMKTVI